MTYEQKIECWRRGTGSNLKDDDVPLEDWLWGNLGRSSTLEEQIEFVKQAFRGDAESTLKVVYSILEIPAGQVITYSELARRTNSNYGTNVGARNTASTRRRIYRAVGHDTQIPIHRIKKEDDEDSAYDHPITREFNRVLRIEERVKQ